MRKKVIISVGLVALLFFAVVYRFVQVLPYPQGGGRYQESPNKRFTAHASNLTDCSFFGGEKSYYEFTIESEPPLRVRRMTIDAPPEGIIEWRDEGTIQWASDSSSVTYNFKGTQLTLSVTP